MRFTARARGDASPVLGAVQGPALLCAVTIVMIVMTRRSATVALEGFPRENEIRLSVPKSSGLEIRKSPHDGPFPLAYVL